MKVPHDAMVVVADGRKLLMLRNQGDADHLNLQLVQKELQPNPRTSEQKTDLSGQAADGQAGQGTMGEPDFHQLEEDRFATEVAAMLREQALRNSFESLIIVAPPRRWANCANIIMPASPSAWRASWRRISRVIRCRTSRRRCETASRQGQASSPHVRVRRRSGDDAGGVP